jgi:DNA ligase-1
VTGTIKVENMSSNTLRFRPLLASDIDAEQMNQLRFPLIGSPKIDGIRVLCHPEFGPVTRSLKPVRNEFVRKYLQGLKWVDGEVTVGKMNAADVFNKTTAIMAGHGEPDFQYHVFDSFQVPQAQYVHRQTLLPMMLSSVGDPEYSRAKILEYEWLNNMVDLQAYEERKLLEGFEGIMLRRPDGAYKYNRSTFKEHILLKLKRFTDDEAVVVGFEPLLRNMNEATINERGFTERSAHKANKIATDMMGKLLVEHKIYEPFSIGSGFDFAQREEIWANQAKYLGKTVTFKYQLHGTIDKPRAPIFLRFREAE